MDYARRRFISEFSVYHSSKIHSEKENNINIHGPANHLKFSIIWKYVVVTLHPINVITVKSVSN